MINLWVCFRIIIHLPLTISFRIKITNPLGYFQIIKIVRIKDKIIKHQVYSIRISRTNPIKEIFFQIKIKLTHLLKITCFPIRIKPILKIKITSLPTMLKIIRPQAPKTRPIIKVTTHKITISSRIIKIINLTQTQATLHKILLSSLFNPNNLIFNNN